MAHPHILGDTKNKEGGLDKHKGLRDNEEVGMSSMIRFVIYMRPLCQEGCMAVLSNMQKPTQRVKENEEKREYVLKKRMR